MNNSPLWARIPAVRALLLQIAALIVVGVLLQIWFGATHRPVSLVVAAVLHGLLAATGAMLLGLAIWWWLIELFFPLAVLLTFSLHVPSWVFLTAFLFFVVLYWSCFRTQVPYFPSRQFALLALLRQLPPNRPVRLIDIGSGLGGLVLDAAARRPDCQITGIELAPLPWLISVLRARWRHSSVHFIRGDYHALDFSSFDVVFAYLSPAAMTPLWAKARAEMQPGSMLLSYEFMVEGQGPDVAIDDPDGGPALYGWAF